MQLDGTAPRVRFEKKLASLCSLMGDGGNVRSKQWADQGQAPAWTRRRVVYLPCPQTEARSRTLQGHH